jgi:hypothetical protein
MSTVNLLRLQLQKYSIESTLVPVIDRTRSIDPKRVNGAESKVIGG